MQLYELNYLLPLKSEGQEAQKIATDIESLIQEKEGILTKRRQKSKLELGYMVEGNSSALRISCEFQMKPEQVKGLRTQIESMPTLRVLLEKKVTRKASDRKRRRRKMFRKSSDEKEIKVELDKIEKKLDEILDES